MSKTLLQYIASSLTQHKGRDLAWVHWTQISLTSAVSGIQFTKEKLQMWKHLLTASRKGNGDVRKQYCLNMFLKIAGMSGYIILWAILHQWFFTDFHPFSYMDVNGNFWQAIIVIGAPLFLFAFLSGQLDWFGSSDAHEDGTIIAESLPFKWLISLEAGITEEITHRGVLIFFGLISVYLSNMLFLWMIMLTVMFICIFALAKHEIRFNVAGPIMLGTLIGLFLVKGYVPENPIYLFNGYILQGLQWLVAHKIILAASIATFSALLFGIRFAMSDKNDDEAPSILECATRIMLTTTWSVYCLPLGVAAITQMPILPSGGDNWTYLLYVGAVLWSNAKFRDGHKYQGPSGMLNSYIIGIYMFYVAFTHGLLYAIVLHVLFDMTIFWSEHVCQVIKNRRLATVN